MAEVETFAPQYGLRERGDGVRQIDVPALEALACRPSERAGYYAAVAREYGQGFASKLQERIERDRERMGEEKAAQYAADRIGRPVEWAR